MLLKGVQGKSPRCSGLDETEREEKASRPQVLAFEGLDEVGDRSKPVHAVLEPEAHFVEPVEVGEQQHQRLELAVRSARDRQLEKVADLDQLQVGLDGPAGLALDHYLRQVLVAALHLVGHLEHCLGLADCDGLGNEGLAFHATGQQS